MGAGIDGNLPRGDVGARLNDRGEVGTSPPEVRMSGAARGEVDEELDGES